MHKDKHRVNINAGTIVFFVILIYILINVIVYVTKDKVSAVEVQTGSIVDYGYYTGLILRTEHVVTTDASGTVYFYIRNGEKVAKNANVYMLSSGSVDVSDSEDTSEAILSNYAQIGRLISSYTASYDDNNYGELYSFRYELQNELTESLSSYHISLIQSSGSSYVDVTAEESGIVCYTYDGMEDLSIDDLTDELYDTSNYEKQQILSNSYVESQSAVYKLVTDADWSIAIRLTQDEAEDLSGQSSVTITLAEDDIDVTADVEVISNGDSMYAVFSLSKYMVNYISDRYIDIEITNTTAEGLKIPTSSLVTKTFYKIPLDYLITDDSTSEEGFYKYTYDETGELTAIFYDSTIYSRDDEYCYVDTDEFQVGDLIGKVNSDETYTISATGELTGVYNINQGYAIFRIVEILYQNDEYCIVASGTSYGISLYDYVVLNADTVDEGDMVY